MPIYECQVCLYKTDRVDNYKRHQAKSTPCTPADPDARQTFTCTKCDDREFSQVESLNMHMAKCNGLKQNECDTCHEVLSTKKALSLHKKSCPALEDASLQPQNIVPVNTANANSSTNTANCDVEAAEAEDADHCDVEAAAEEPSAASAAEGPQTDPVLENQVADTTRELVVATTNPFALKVDDGELTLNGRKIRKTNDCPARVSVFDFISAVTDQHPNHSGRTLSTLCDTHPEVTPKMVDFQFEGQGQRPTPVTDARGLVLIMNLLPGKNAAQFRMKTADVLVRYLGGDSTLIAEINRNAEAQQALHADSFARIFGDAVASTSSAVVVRSTPGGVKSVTYPDDAVLSIVPPAKPGVYFTLVRYPCSDVFEIQGEIPAGKDVIGFGYSATSIKQRIEDQKSETGSYELLDYVESSNAQLLEKELKRMLKCQEDIKRLYGICKKSGAKKTEFVAAAQYQYQEIFQYAVDENKEIESRKMSNELLIEIERTKQSDAGARKAEADAEAKKAEASARTTVELRRLDLVLECARSGMDIDKLVRLAEVLKPS